MTTDTTTGTEPAQETRGHITIKHDHENGTLVYGTSKGDGVYELIGPRTLARFKYFRSIRMIGIPQSRDHLAKRGQIQWAREALEAAGFTVTVEIDDTPRDVAQVKADRAGRLDDRHDALAAKADRKRREGDSRHEAAEYIGQRFAGGQPILVGHHSERRARRDQARMDGHDRAAHAAWDEADRAAQAAAVVGREEARRERPDVIIRRIDKHEAELRQTMHHINGTRPANDWRGAYYAPERNPATGDWLEQCQARKTFLEHQLEADRAAMAEHVANGYVWLTREKVHKGDLVTWSSRQLPVLVTRVNPKTVTLDRTSYPRTLPYEEILAVDCPHDGSTTMTRVRRPAAQPQPAPAKVERPAEREAPIEVGAQTEFFPTPAAVAERMVALAGIRPAMTVLEPSAGLGAIARVAAAAGAAVDCIERDHRLAGRLKDAGKWYTLCADFLDVEPDGDPYDRVLMNPPFANQADIRHVTHALRFLKPGGLLVAVMSAGAEFRQDKTAEGFRKMVADRGGWFEALPDGSFEVSGTATRTVLVAIPAG